MEYCKIQVLLTSPSGALTIQVPSDNFAELVMQGISSMQVEICIKNTFVRKDVNKMKYIQMKGYL